MRLSIRMILASLMLAPVMALAADGAKSEPVSVHMDAYKIVVEKGIEHKKQANMAYPGDVLEYRATYTNNTDHDISDLKATLPVPAGMELLPDTTSPAGAKASLDGARYADIPLMRKVKQPDGTWKEEKVPYKEYRSLRWNLNRLAAGKNKVVVARMRVSPLDNQVITKGGGMK